MSGFLGQFQTSIDDKGRIALPSKLRQIANGSGKLLLEGDLVLTKGLEGCLSLYPQGKWEDIQSRLSTLNFTKKDFRFFGRRFYASAAIVTPDKAGRILLPQHLIAEASLKKELMIIGVFDYLELWNPDRYQYYLEQYSASYEEVAERLFSGDGRRDEQED